jgi:hypothetical protein
MKFIRHPFFLLTLIILIIVGGFSFLNLISINYANILESPSKNQLEVALKNNDINFFSKLEYKHYENIDSLTKIYQNKMDIYVYEDLSYIFFSFLAIKENSSVLIPVYGVIDKKLGLIEINPEISFSLDYINKNTLQFINNSNFPVPIDNSFLLLPDDIKGSIISNNDIMNRKDSFKFVSETEIPNTIKQLENITYGYKVILDN